MNQFAKRLAEAIRDGIGQNELTPDDFAIVDVKAELENNGDWVDPSLGIEADGRKSQSRSYKIPNSVSGEVIFAADERGRNVIDNIIKQIDQSDNHLDPATLALKPIMPMLVKLARNAIEDEVNVNVSGAFSNDFDYDTYRLTLKLIDGRSE